MDKEKIEIYIKNNQEMVLKKCSNILGKNINMQNFNGIFGSKNRYYHVEPENHPNADEYIKAWFDSFESLYKLEKDKHPDRSSHRIKRLLKDEDIKKFVIVYLARTYLKKTS